MEISELSDLTPTEFKLERISIVTGEYYDELDEDELDELINSFDWLDAPIKGDECSIRFNTMKWGVFIDINKFIANKIPIQSFDKIVTVVLGYDDFKIGRAHV